MCNNFVRNSGTILCSLFLKVIIICPHTKILSNVSTLIISIIQSHWRLGFEKLYISIIDSNHNGGIKISYLDFSAFLDLDFPRYRCGCNLLFSSIISVYFLLLYFLNSASAISSSTRDLLLLFFSPLLE